MTKPSNVRVKFAVCLHEINLLVQFVAVCMFLICLAQVSGSEELGGAVLFSLIG